MDWEHRRYCLLHNLRFYDNILDISPHQSSVETAGNVVVEIYVYKILN